MVLRPTRSTLTCTLFPYTSLVRSVTQHVDAGTQEALVDRVVAVQKIADRVEHDVRGDDGLLLLGGIADHHAIGTVESGQLADILADLLSGTVVGRNDWPALGVTEPDQPPAHIADTIDDDPWRKRRRDRKSTRLNYSH